MNELAMNLATACVHHGYLEILVVGKAIQVKSAVQVLRNARSSALVLNSSPIRSLIGTPSFISKKKIFMAVN